MQHDSYTVSGSGDRITGKTSMLVFYLLIVLNRSAHTMNVSNNY